MIKTTIEHFGTNFRIEQGEYYVDVEIDGDKAYFISFLEGDEHTQHGHTHKDDAMAQALCLFGIL